MVHLKGIKFYKRVNLAKYKYYRGTSTTLGGNFVKVQLA
jgi:hypothetical protein